MMRSAENERAMATVSGLNKPEDAAPDHKAGKMRLGLRGGERAFLKLLIRRLTDPELSKKTELSAWLLLHLSRHPARTTALLQAGAAEALVGVIRRLPAPWGPSEQPDEQMDDEGEDTLAEDTVEYATGALAHLVKNDYSCRVAVAEAGAVGPLVALLAEGPDCISTENAVAVLNCLAASTPAARDEIRNAEGISAMVHLLTESPVAHNLVLTRSLLWTIICLSEQHAENQAAVWDANGCGALTNIMEGNHFLNATLRSASGVLPLTARCLSIIAQDSTDTQFAVHRLGVVPKVVRVLEGNVPWLGKSPEELEEAWRRDVAGLFALWALLQQAHERVAGGVVVAPGAAAAILDSKEKEEKVEKEEEEKGEEGEEGGAGAAEGAQSLRGGKESSGKEQQEESGSRGKGEEEGDGGDIETIEGETDSQELEENVWTAWREIALELLMRVLPVTGQRLHPTREPLRALKSLVASAEIGPQRALEAGAVPVLVRALAVQLDSGRPSQEFVTEPAEILAAVLSECSPEAQDQLLAAGGIELLVRMLPVAEAAAEEDESENADQDDVIRFWWDRIMWGEDDEGVRGDFPFHVCKVAAAALDAGVDGCPKAAEAAMAACAMPPLVQLLHNAVCCRRHNVVLATTGALAALMDGNMAAQKEFLCRRGIAPLMSLLRLPVSTKILPMQIWLLLQTKAALCVQRLVEDFPHGQRRMRQAGALPCLLHVLEEVLGASGQHNPDRARTYVVGAQDEDIEQAALDAALWAINNIVANNQENLDALRRAMGVPTLVAVLRHPRVGEAATGAVWSVAQLASGGSRAQEDLAEAEVIPELIKVARQHRVADDPLCEGVARAVGALANNSPSNQDRLRAAGALELMVEMLKCGADTVTAECSAQSLAALCWNHPANQALMGEIGGLKLLIQQLMAGPHSLLSRGASLALAAAMGENFANQSIVREAGGTFVLVDMLRSGHQNPVVVPALHALGLMVKGHRAAQSEVGDAGGVSQLLRILGTKEASGEVRREAAAALSALTRDHPGNKSAVMREGGFSLLTDIVRSGCEALSSRSPALPGAWDAKAESSGAINPFERDGTLPTELGIVGFASATLTNLVTGNTKVKEELRKREGIELYLQLLGLCIKAREHWPEGSVWINTVSGEAAAMIAALCKGSTETKSEIGDHGGLETLVWGLKLGDRQDRAVEEAACIMRCLISPAHAFWDETMASIDNGPEARARNLQDCVTKYYKADQSLTLQHRALELILSTEIETRSQFIWALLQLVTECDKNRLELSELYATGIAPLKRRLEEITNAAGQELQQQQSSMGASLFKGRMANLVTRYMSPIRRPGAPRASAAASK